MSYNIGLSGLRSTNQALDVISQNIANVSTAGFKAARAEYAALYAGGEAGGVEIAQVSQDFSKDGSKEYTGRSLDLAISGQGFFVTKNSLGQMAFTRAGTFNKDANNNIVSASGNKLQGYGVDTKHQLLTGVVSDIKIADDKLPAVASTNVDLTLNLKADASVITNVFDSSKSDTYNFSQSAKIYDSLGTEHIITQYYSKTSNNTWTVHYQVDGDSATTTSSTLNFDGKGRLINGGNNVIHNISFTPSNGARAVSVDLDFGKTVPVPPATADEIEAFTSRTSQYAADFTGSYDTDGYSAADLAGVRVDDNGAVYAVFTNGKDLLQGQVVLANFANPNGLDKSSDTAWTQTFASGNATLGAAGTGGMGSLTAGAYEGSNVDLTGELVNLMTAQRNYQANAKSISTADKMTQVLFSSW